MAAFNFPNSPSTNDLHTENGVTFKWNGTIWLRVGNSYSDISTLNVSGISTFGGNIDANGDIDVDGHTNLDNVSIAGVTTIADNSKLALGTGEDLSLYHTSASNDGFIKYQNGDYDTPVITANLVKPIRKSDKIPITFKIKLDM